MLVHFSIIPLSMHLLPAATSVELLLIAIAGLQLVLALVTLAQPNSIPSKLLAIINIGLLLVGTYVALMYTVEVLVAWYVGYLGEQVAFYTRALGNYGLDLYLFSSVIMLAAPQLFWFKKIRYSAGKTAFVCFLILLTFYLLNYYVILFGTTNRDYLPSSWS